MVLLSTFGHCRTGFFVRRAGFFVLRSASSVFVHHPSFCVLSAAFSERHFSPFRVTFGKADTKKI
jgi:hypothetical protein